MEFIILCILIFIIWYFLKSKSSFALPTNNILIVACHIKKNFDIVKNNISYFNNFKVILVYSFEPNADITFNNLPDNVVLIEDTENVYYDFYKYKLAWEYINSNKINYNWVLVTNDSFIITGNIDTIINTIINDTKLDYIGILEVNEHIFENNKPKLHYQSWWLNFKKNSFDYFINQLKFKPVHTNVKMIIDNFEIDLSNKMINKFKSKCIFPLIDKSQTGNVFLDENRYYDYYYNRNFKFVKIKHMHPELVPLNLIYGN